MRFESHVWRMYCQMSSWALSSGQYADSLSSVMLGGTLQGLGGVPACAINQYHSMASKCYVLCNLRKMVVHGLCIGIRQDPFSSLSACRKDGTEDVGVVITLVLGLARSCSFLRPLIGEPIFLADTSLVLELDFNGRACCE
jgi:hypothetical protein